MNLEDENIEYKVIATDSLKKEIVAFANSQGGIIYIGIKDDGTVAGISDPDHTMLQVGNMIRDAIRPDVTMFTKYYIEKKENKNVIVIDVREGANKPYYIAKNGMKPSGVYVRQGNASAPASEEAIRQMIKNTDGDSFESMRSLNQELTFTATEKSFHDAGISFKKTNMKTLGFIDAAGQYTNIGLLLSDQCPYTIKCAVFSSEDQSDFSDRREFSGSLLKQVDDVYGYIEKYNKLGAEFKGLRRTDIRDYPEDAIREALLNAVVHRDYTYSASTLISLFSNRIEFISVGGLVKGITLDDILMGISICRNKSLANIFYRLKLIEAYGTGIAKINNAYRNKAVQPEIKVSPHIFKVILPGTLTHIQEKPPTKEEDVILKFAQTHEEFTRSDIDRLLSSSQSTSSRLLKAMLEKNEIVKIGRGKQTKYKLNI